MSKKFILFLVLLVAFVVVLVVKSFLDLNFGYLDIVLACLGIIPSLYILSTENFKFRLLIYKIWSKKTGQNVFWSLNSTINIDVTDVIDLDSIKGRISNIYKGFRVNSEGKDFLNIHVKELSSVKILVRNYDEYNSVEITVLPFQRGYFDYEKVIRQIIKLIDSIKTPFKVIEDMYSIDIEFNSNDQNPYYSFLKPYYSEANLKEMSMMLRMKSKNNVNTTISKSKVSFNCNKSLIEVRDNIEEVLIMSKRS